MVWTARTLAGAAALATAAGVAVTLWLPAPSSEDGPVDATPFTTPPASPTLADAGLAPPRPPAALAGPSAQLAAPPAGLDAAQWNLLRQQLAGRPDELRRVVRHLEFTDAMRRFRSGEGSVEERAALARQVDAGIDPGLAQRELSAGEARLIKLAVLEVLQPDAAQRVAEIAQWESAHTQPLPDAGVAEHEFQRRQAAIAAAWTGLPASQRDPQALAQRLDALRVQMFGDPQPKQP